MDRALAAGLAAIKTAAGVSVTYRRGAQSVALTAVRGETATSVEGAEGQRARVFTRDYLIDAEDLDFGDGAVEPAIGDVITDAGVTYEVTPLTGTELPWRWHDPPRTRYRVHCVES